MTSFPFHRRGSRDKQAASLESVPLLNFISATPGAHRMTYADRRTPSSPRKPKDAQCLQVFAAMTPNGLGSVEDARYVRTVTRTPFEITWSDEHDGAVATYYARWMSARGETGPWSLPVSVRVLV